METPLELTSDGNMLEGLIDRQPGHKAVVITHPHPLMGGDMHNPVVDLIREVYRGKGFTTLRFNFRGTGASGGVHDHGRGEINDVKAAISYLTENGYSDIDLSGYSFGAWINILTAEMLETITRLILVSPPVDYIEFKPFQQISGLYLVVCGDEDIYGTSDHIKKLLKYWNKDAILSIINGADHFYSGEFRNLRGILEKYL